MTPDPAGPPDTPPKTVTARGFGLFITHATKIAGLGLAVNEAIIRTDLRPVVLAVAAFMMAGAQGLETFLDKLLGPK